MRPSRFLALFVLIGSAPTTSAQVALGPPFDPVPGHVVIANRGDGTITVIDAQDDTVQSTVVLPGASQAEPMYVVFARTARRVFVGDRANDAVVAFDARTFAVVGSVPVGSGVFHMEIDGPEGQMWVVNDIDNTLSVFDPSTLAPIATVPAPADLVAQGAKPHDVVLDPRAPSAFVTFFNVPGPDVLVRFSTTTFLETGRVATVEAPHALTSSELPVVLVPGGGTVEEIHRTSLRLLGSVPAVGAHGTALGRENRVFYTTNFAGGGVDAVHAIDPRTMQLIASADAPAANPHNVAVTLDGKKLYCTHSVAGGSDVSVFDLDPQTGAPTFRTLVSAGSNPFGLAASR